MKRIKQLIWPFIMGMYGVTLLILMVRDELNAYIHPRLHYLMLFTMIILFILAYVTGRDNIKKNKQPALQLSYVVFLCPLLLFSLSTDSDASMQVAVENGLKISAISEVNKEEMVINATEAVVLAEKDQIIGGQKSEDASNEESSLASEEITETDVTNEERPTIDSAEEANASMSGEQVIHLTDENFTSLMEDIHMNLDKYTGREISYLGLVYKQEDFGSEEVVIGRLVMYCCAADAQVVGMLGQYYEDVIYEDGDWVEITAYISEKDYHDPVTDYSAVIPYLQIIKMSPGEEPEDPYVYFDQ